MENKNTLDKTLKTGKKIEKKPIDSIIVQNTQKESLPIKNEVLVKNNILKEKLKNKEEMEKMLKSNGLYENFELCDYIGSGSESIAYSILIKYKNRKGEKNIKKAVVKAIISSRNKKDIEKETFASSKLKNSNIIDFYAFVKSKKGPLSLIFMEQAKYGNIKDFLIKTLKKPTFPESAICFFAAQILNGIQYCHKSKIAHMDIKPHNIVINDLCYAKLIDFSISLNYKDKNPDKEFKLPLKGTSFYMSKEVLGQSKIKYKDLNKIDLYSFGVVLFNLAFGTYPYGLTYGDEKNHDIILKKIKENELVFPDEKNFSKYFLDFLKKLLAKNIYERISLNEAMNHYWIKGATILNDEKEKSYNMCSFLGYLLTDHIKDFNDYIHKY